MSDGITLSDELIGNLYSVIQQHDAAVEQNMMVALQYFAAVSGYMLADYPGPESEREELIEQLAAFTSHVAQDRAKQKQAQEAPQQQPQAATGKSVLTDDPAVGIWKPE